MTGESTDAPGEDRRELEILMAVIKGHGLETFKKQCIVRRSTASTLLRQTGLSRWYE